MAERIAIVFNPKTQLHTEHRRAMPTQEEIDYRNDFNERRRNHALTDEELSKEKRRQRGSHVANDIKNLLLAHEFKYFNTFTSDVLSNDSRELLKAVQTYLKGLDTPFLCFLEAFYYEEDGFHVHAFTDIKVDFTNWFRKYGGIKVDSINVEDFQEIFGEHWDLPTDINNIEANLYSEKIQDYPKTISYSIKKISITKDRLPLYSAIYKHNLHDYDVCPNVKISATIDDNENLIIDRTNLIADYLIRKDDAINNGIDEKSFILEELSIIRRLKTRYIFQNRKLSKSQNELLRFIKQDLERYNNANTDINHNSNNLDNNISITNVENTEIINNFDVLSIVPIDSDCRIDYQKFSYVCVGTKNKEKSNNFGVIKSNTGYYRCPIPFENAVKIEKILNFANFLRLYIGYICHIPD